jgi:molecular chaperone GrpE
MSKRRRKGQHRADASSEKIRKDSEERPNAEADSSLEDEPRADREAVEEEESGAGEPAVLGSESSEELVRAQARIEELKELLLRKQAEFENYRKRMERERADYLRYAAFDVLKEVLPVLDNLERAVEASRSGTEEQLREGVEIIQKQFRDVLAKLGLSEVETEDKPFDPHVHEAVGRVETDELPEGQVVEVFQKGYHFKDRLLRPSMVSVAHPASDSGAESEKAKDNEESEDKVVRHED